MLIKRILTDEVNFQELDELLNMKFMRREHWRILLVCYQHASGVYFYRTRSGEKPQEPTNETLVDATRIGSILVERKINEGKSYKRGDDKRTPRTYTARLKWTEGDWPELQIIKDALSGYQADAGCLVENALTRKVSRKLSKALRGLI